MNSHRIPARFRSPRAAFFMVLLACSGLSMPLSADTESINNAVWKLLYGVTDAQMANPAWLNADDDGDGIKNGAEIAAGTNPFSNTSTIKINSIVKNGGN